MDISKYIESGILELYVSGVSTEQESVEVTKYANIYPKIKQEILEIEKALINLSVLEAKITDPSFFNKTTQKIEFDNVIQKMTISNLLWMLQNT